MCITSRTLSLIFTSIQRGGVLEKDDWKGLYFVKMLSLMAVCASGSLKSSLTICKVSNRCPEVVDGIMKMKWAET